MTSRWTRAQDLARSRSVGALLITPGADLRYLTGYHAKPLERLTCLVVPADGDPVLVAPALERAAAEASGVEVEIATFGETDDPYARVGSLLPADAVVAVDNQMWAERVLAFQRRFADVRLAGPLLAELRMRKDPHEVAALRDAGAAIDRVHQRMGEWLRPGRTEREVGADIGRAILEEGHEQVDFVIVGSGPNGASPHHEVSDRVIQEGDPVVVDIGGTNAAGYCSDCTRNYLAGGTAPREYLDAYAVTPGSETSSSTAPATASAPRRTRSRTSWRATSSSSSPAWPSRSSPACTSRVATARGSRTSPSAPTTASRC